jgi:hypothetical protein
VIYSTHTIYILTRYYWPLSAVACTCRRCGQPNSPSSNLILSRLRICLACKTNKWSASDVDCLKFMQQSHTDISDSRSQLPTDALNSACILRTGIRRRPKRFGPLPGIFPASLPPAPPLQPRSPFLCFVCFCVPYVPYVPFVPFVPYVPSVPSVPSVPCVPCVPYMP